MSLLSRPKHLVSAIVRTSDGFAMAMGRLGVGAFGWPLAIAIGLVAGLFGLHEPKFAQGWLQHRAALDYMRPLLRGVAAAAVSTALVALAIALFRRRRGAPSVVESYLGVLRRGAFLAALPLVVQLVTRPAPDREWFVFSLILAVAALVTYSAYHFVAVTVPPRDVGRLERGVAVGVVVAGALAYAVQMARMGIANHLRFNTGRTDLGIYMSLFRETTQGKLLACSLCGSGRHPYSHFEPIVAFLAPLYLLRPEARTLIVLGCVLVASGAVPLYLFARRHLGEGAAVALSLAYLAYPALSEVALFDFHGVELAIPVAFWLFYSLERGAMRTYYVFAVVLLLLREDMGLVLATVGLHLLVSGGPSHRGVAVRTLALSAAGLVVAHFAAPRGVTGVFGELVSGFTVGPRRAPRIAAMPELPLALTRRLLSESKGLHVAELLAPLLVLPLLGPGRLLLLYGGLVTLFATTPYTGTAHAHEAALVIPFLFVLTVTALGKIMRAELSVGKVPAEALGKALAFGVFTACLLAGLSLGPLGKNDAFRAGPRNLERNPSAAELALDSRLRKLSASWPRGTKVAASNALVSHLPGASHLYTLDDREQSDYVVASMKARPVANRLEAEQSAQELLQTATFDDVRVYRPHYGQPLPSKARRLDDE